MAVTMIARMVFDKLKLGMDGNLNGRLNQFTSVFCFREKFGEKGRVLLQLGRYTAL